MNKVPKIVCVSMLVCSNAPIADDAVPQFNKSYRSWFWQRQFSRSGHWRDRSEFTLCPRCRHRLTKMLRSIANVRFGEAEPQHRDHLPMSGKGRSCHSSRMAESMRNWAAFRF
jgi:hypothetical protein